MSWLTLWNHLSAFWTIVVVSCASPANWDNCKDVHVWLVPELQNGVRLIMQPDSLYQQERNYLEP